MSAEHKGLFVVDALFNFMVYLITYLAFLRMVLVVCGCYNSCASAGSRSWKQPDVR